MKDSYKAIGMAILGIGIILMVGLAVVSPLKALGSDYTAYCDKTYGKDSWTTIEYYNRSLSLIGASYKCVSNDDPLAKTNRLDLTQ